MICLPQTSTRRGAVATVTLVESVDTNPRVPGGLAWRGRSFRPGAAFPERELLATYSSSPGVAPLALEHTEIAEQELDPAGRKRWRTLQVLWRYQRASRSWIEMARIVDPGAHSGFDLRQLAAQALRQDVWREVESMDETVTRIHSYLQDEMRQLGERRLPVMERVFHQLVWRMVEESGASLALPIPSSVRSADGQMWGGATHT